MSKRYLLDVVVRCGLFLLVLGYAAGCAREQGPFERTGENIDEAVDDVGEAIEETGEELDEET